MPAPEHHQHPAGSLGRPRLVLVQGGAAAAAPVPDAKRRGPLRVLSWFWTRIVESLADLPPLPFGE